MTDADAVKLAHKRIAELEAQLRAAESHRRLFEYALDLMCVAGPDGYFKEVNESWTKTLGWSRDELTAVPFLEFVHPDDLEATHAAGQRLALGAGVTAFRNRYRHKNGSYRWLSWNAVLDPDTRSIWGVARDISEVVATRQALEASEAAYKQLFDGMLDGFSYHEMIFDEAGNAVDYRFRAVNPAFEEMTGLKAEELIGRRVLEVLPGTEKHWIEVFGRVATTGTLVRYENYSREFDKWFEVLAFRPGPGQFACTFHDITARKRAETERAELQAQVAYTQKLESLGTMVGGIAHDFNNLLTTIMGGIELANHELARDAVRAKDWLATAAAAADRARDLCRQMLTYAGRAESQKGAFDLTELTREIIPLAVPAISKKVRVRTDFPAAPLSVFVDRAQITQVVLNLLINAGDAIGDVEGEIGVRTGARQFAGRELMSFATAGVLAPGPYAFVEVTDTGLGMSRATMAKIFDPFFTTKATGRGLGLAATLGIARAHGGGIQVESEPGAGSRFLFLLPLAPGQATRAEATRPVQPAMRAGLILVCDDEAPVRGVTVHMLNSLGFDVLEASDGEQALKLSRDRCHELRAVLLDMAMPKMGGLEVVPLLRQRRPDIPIVLMSGYDESRMADKLSDGHLTFLQKPFRKADLQRALSHVLTDAST